MTVNDMILFLENLRNQGCGEHDVLTFDPDENEWLPITGATYGGTNEGDDRTRFVKLYTDDP